MGGMERTGNLTPYTVALIYRCTYVHLWMFVGVAALAAEHVVRGYGRRWEAGFALANCCVGFYVERVDRARVSSTGDRKTRWATVATPQRLRT